MFQGRLWEVLLFLFPSSMLTSLVYLYLNPGKPTKKVNHPTETFPKDEKNLMQGGETILLLNSKGDWEYAPSAKRDARVKF